MKKNILIIIIGAITAYSCSNLPKVDRVVEQKYPNGTPQLIVEYSTNKEVREKKKEIKLYPDGKREYEGDYKNDKRDGKWIYYHPNGNKWSEGTFKDGLGEGKRIVYYETGAKRYAGFFKQGLPSGKWTYWDENGKVVNIKDYDNSTDNKPVATDFENGLKPN